MRAFVPTSLAVLAACASTTPAPESAPAEAAPELTIVAESPRRWTGVAVDREGTVYVNFPRWSDDVPVSVAALGPGGEVLPFPDASWQAGPREDADLQRTWVCVQSVHVDGAGRLWVLDPGNPGFAGVIEGAPKLVRFDLPSREPAQVIPFAAPVVTPGSYLNDVRIDLARNVAYLTDSGDGALVVVDLASGDARRVLDDHPSTGADDVSLTIGGQPFDREVHADGIAYDPEADVLYFQALRARTLYRVPGASLRDPAADVEADVAAVAESGASDGLLWFEGHVYVSALEEDAIVRVAPDGTREVVVQDPHIAWPDSFAAHEGALYFTTAQIHLGDAPTDPFRVWRLTP
ncbi:MAG: L-dopachrome tautomerase-related protein [Myxococcota bacterium]